MSRLRLSRGLGLRREYQALLKKGRRVAGGGWVLYTRRLASGNRTRVAVSISSGCMGGKTTAVLRNRLKRLAFEVLRRHAPPGGAFEIFLIARGPLAFGGRPELGEVEAQLLPIMEKIDTNRG